MAERSGSPHRSLYKLVGSPPWKEAFRQGCLERMRNNRDRLLNKYRQAGGSMLGRVQSTLLVQELMKEEWNALQSMERCPEALAQWEMPMDVAELEEIQQELIDQEQSIISEYEKSLQFDEKCLSIILAEWEANSLICPVCTKYNLRITSGVVMCQCGLYIPSHSPELTEQKLRARLEVSVNEHSAHCPHTPVFSVTEGTEKKSNLLMSCLLPQWDELSRLQSAVELSWSVGLLETGKAPDQVLEEMGLQHLGCDDLKPAFTHFVLLGWKQLST